MVEVEKLNLEEQAAILKKTQLLNLQKALKKPIANYDMKKVKPATMDQIDKWKHASRVKI